MKESIAAALRNRIAHTAHYNSPNSVQRVISLSARLRNAYAKVSGIKKNEPVIAAAPLDKPTNIANVTITSGTIVTASQISADATTSIISGPTLAQKYAHELSVLGTSVDNISRVFEKPMTAFEIATAFAQLNVTAHITLSHDKDYEVAARPHVQYVHAIAAVAKQIANADPREQMLWRVLDAQKQMGRTQVVAEEGAEGNVPPPEDDNTLKITIDADSTKLVQRLYVDYVSETNMAKLPQFMIAFDRLLFKFRDGKPLSPEEIHEVNEVDQARAIKKKKAKKSKKPVRTEAPTDTGEGEAPQEEAAPPEDEEPGDLDEVEVASSFNEITAASQTSADKWFIDLFNLFEGNRNAFIFFLRAFGEFAPQKPISWMDFWLNSIVRSTISSFRPFAVGANGTLFLKNKQGTAVELSFGLDSKRIDLVSQPVMVEPGKTLAARLVTGISIRAPRAYRDELEKIDRMSYEQAQEYFKQRATGGE